MADLVEPTIPKLTASTTWDDVFDIYNNNFISLYNYLKNQVADFIVETHSFSNVIEMDNTYHPNCNELLVLMRSSMR